MLSDLARYGVPDLFAPGVRNTMFECLPQQAQPERLSYNKWVQSDTAHKRPLLSLAEHFFNRKVPVRVVIVDKIGPLFSNAGNAAAGSDHVYARPMLSLHSMSPFGHGTLMCCRNAERSLKLSYQAFRFGSSGRSIGNWYHR